MITIIINKFSLNIHERENYLIGLISPISILSLFSVCDPLGSYNVGNRPPIPLVAYKS